MNAIVSDAKLTAALFPVSVVMLITIEIAAGPAIIGKQSGTIAIFFNVLSESARLFSPFKEPIRRDSPPASCSAAMLMPKTLKIWIPNQTNTNKVIATANVVYQ